MVLLDVRVASATAVVRRSQSVIRACAETETIAWLDDRVASIARHCEVGHTDSLWTLVRELSGRRRGRGGAAVLKSSAGVVLSCREDVRTACEHHFLAEFSMNGVVATADQWPVAARFVPLQPQASPLPAVGWGQKLFRKAGAPREGARPLHIKSSERGPP